MEKMEYELTFPQKNIWLVENYNKGTALNVIAGSVKINRGFNEEKCEIAINKVIEENVAMRTRIKEEKGKVMQYFAPYSYEKIEVVDLSSLSKKEILEYIDGLTFQSFFAKDKKLYNFKILRTGKNSGYIFMCIHHIISDAWSCSKIVKSLTETLETIGTRNENSEEKIVPEYTEYIEKEEEYKNSDKYVKDEEFWNEYLKGFSEVVSLKDKKKTSSLKANRYSVKLDKDLNDRITNYCKENKISPYALFLTAISTYIYRVKDKNDFVLGTPVLNRANFKEKQMLGMFVSTLPLRVKVEENIKFLDLAKEISKNNFSMFRHQKYPYSKMLEYVHKNSDIKNNLYNIAVSFQNAKTDIMDNDKYETNWTFSKALDDEIQIHISDIDDTGIYSINYDYKEELFEKIEVEYIHLRLMSIIENAIKDVDVDVENIEIMPESEKNKILYEFNNTKKEYPKNKTVIELFEEQVNKTPDNVALVFEGEKMTYKELNERANSLAHYLVENENVKPNDVVGLMVDKSFELIIGTLAILKIGAVYLPIDKSYPEERINYMVADSKCKIILSDEEKKLDCKVIVIDSNILSNNNYYFITFNGLNNNVAYVMYTSGSTGKPKGVCVTNKNIIRLVKNTNYVDFFETDSILQTGSSVFDASTFEFWGALLNGIKLYLIKKEELLNPSLLEKKIKEWNVTILWLTAPLFNQMSDYNPEMFKSLRVLLVGGDVLSIKHINKVRECCKKLEIINGYGPTENTTFSTCFKIERTYNESIPIGYPISNSTCYVMDTKNRLLPIGIEGELVVGGDGVSNGYINNKKLTNERYVKNIIPNEKWAYKTGDIVFYDMNGIIHYVGRRDFQLKIRGHRVELDEIKKAIISIKEIKDAYVLAKKEEGGYKIFAYYIKNNSEKIDIKDELNKILPDYMVPHVLIEVNNIPLNQNGKVNREKLFAENKEILVTSEKVNEPKTGIQREIARILQKNLDISKIDVKNNLFDYGMDSLNAIKISIDISKFFNINITARDILEYNSVEKLEKYVKNSNVILPDNIIVKADGKYPLTDSQMGIFVEYSKDPDVLLYNIPFEVVLDKEWSIDLLERSIREAINNHKALFTKFEIDGNNIFQTIKVRDFKISIHENMRKEEYESYKNNFSRPFDLLNDILFRIAICTVNERIYILFDVHHIIFDGTSINILVNDILRLLQNKQIREDKIIPGKCALLEAEEKNSKFYNYAKKEMLEIYSEELNISTIPYDNLENGNTKRSNGLSEEFYIDNDIIEKIKMISKKYKVTENNIFISMFSILLSKYTYSDHTSFGIISSNRNTEEELNSVGMYAKTIPLKIDIDYSNSIGEYLKSTQEKVMNFIEYNMTFSYKDLASELSKNNDIKSELIKVLFIYQKLNAEELTNKIQINEIDNKVAKFDLVFQVIPVINSLKIRIDYSSDLYTKNTVKGIGKHFIDLLRSLTNEYENETEIRKLEIIGQEEKKEIIEEFNNTNTDYGENLSISQVFEKQVEKNMNGVALILGDKKITYDELNKLSNKLARFLREEKNVIPNQVISIIADKSFEMVIAILGIIKSGACYLPIDIDLPEDRINYMISNSKSKIIINCSNKEVEFIEKENRSIDVIDFKNIKLKEYDDTNLVNVNISSDRAYVMYTSGSTGKPKGCMNSHKGVLKLVRSINYLDINQVKNVFLAGNLVFDSSLHELWLCLLNLKTGILINKDIVLTPSLYKKYFETYDNSLAIFTTQLFHQYAYNTPEMFKNAKYIISGGDVLLYQYVNNMKKYCKNTEVINIYGPAECSAASTTFLVDESIKGNPIPIGKPISNTRCYILDKQLNICPINVQGELYIGGDGVGMGYINNPIMTKKVFINNFIDNHSEKLYKTGDIVKLNYKGNIEYLGREDKQIKIRGYRVEISEIENIALEYNGIKEVKIVVKKRGIDKKLIMYFTSDKKINIAHLKKKFLFKLPRYMVPEYIMQIEKMPLTPNGKIDEKMLPDIDSIRESSNIVKPKNEVEEKLEKIVCQILQLNECSVEDNLFNIGLDSINATKLCIEAMNDNIEISYADIFSFPSIRELAKLSLEKGEKNNNYDIENYDYSKVNKLLKNDVEVVQGKIKDVLITGANGFLGSHILAEYLDNYKGIAYCVVRKKGKKSGEERLKSILKYYFKDKYDFAFESRIKVVDEEISGVDFEDKLNSLIPKTNINKIINSVARVKHFGRKEEFFKLNVEATNKLINIALKNNLKLIQISTLSVSGNGIEGGFTSQKLNNNIKFTEKDLYVGQSINNIYSYSKFLAERNILENVINNNLNSCIIRVGNLMGRVTDGKFQKNKNENAFIDRIKFLIENRIIPKSITENNYIELSPVDLTAKGVLKISELKKCNYVYHLYNYNHYSIDEFIKYLSVQKNIKVKVLDDNEFYKELDLIIKENKSVNFAIVSDLNSEHKLDYSSNIEISCNVSKKLFKLLDFKWNIIDYDYWNKFLKELNIRRIIKGGKSIE